MANPVPNNLALSVINTNDTAQSAPLRNNFASIQTAVNQLIADLSGGTAGQLLSAVDGTDVQWVSKSALPGFEIGYDQITAPVSVTGTTSGTATSIIAGSAYTFDGSPVIAEFYAPWVKTPSLAVGNFTIVSLFEGATALAVSQHITPAAASAYSPGTLKFRFTPSAGAHTYSIKSFVTNTTGTPQIGAGTGAAGADAPAFLRFTKV